MSPTLEKGDIVLSEDHKTLLTVTKVWSDPTNDRWSIYPDYNVQVTDADGKLGTYGQWSWPELEDRRPLDKKLKLGDVVEIKTECLELNKEPRGKIVKINEDNLLKPYLIRELEGGLETYFSRFEFTKLLSATSWEKRQESITALDEEIKDTKKKLKALKIAREVLDYVRT